MSKRVSAAMALAVFLVAVVAALAVHGQSRRGCCKVRDSSGAQWKVSDRNETYKQCIQRNEDEDGDNVLDQRGLVWWDKRCASEED